MEIKKKGQEKFWCRYLIVFAFRWCVGHSFSPTLSKHLHTEKSARVIFLFLIWSNYLEFFFFLNVVNLQDVPRSVGKGHGPCSFYTYFRKKHGVVLVREEAIGSSRALEMRSSSILSLARTTKLALREMRFESLARCFPASALLRGKAADSYPYLTAFCSTSLCVCQFPESKFTNTSSSGISVVVSEGFNKDFDKDFDKALTDFKW